MNFLTSKRAIGGALATLLILAALGAATNNENSSQAENISDYPAASTTFLQLWNRQLNIGRNHWINLFSDLHQLGFSRVILQWSQYGEYSFTAPNSQILKHIIAAAEENDIALWLGLNYVPDFWAHIEHRSISDLKGYLDKRKNANRELLIALQHSLPKPLPEQIEGIYIADEIDDINWVKPQNRRAFKNYLRNVSDLVSLYIPVKTLAISSFSNGRFSPLQYADYLAEIIADTGITALLFQDGVGAKKLSTHQAGQYALSLTNKLQPGITVWTVIELFEQVAPDAEFTAKPAPWARVASQLKNGQSVTPESIAVFSAPDYLLENFSGRRTALGKIWQESMSSKKAQ